MMPVNVNNNPAVSVIKSKEYPGIHDQKITYKNWRVKVCATLKKAINPAKMVLRFIPEFFKEWGSRIIKRDRGTHIGMLIGIVPWVFTTFVIDPILSAGVAIKVVKQNRLPSSMSKTDYSEYLEKGNVPESKTLKDLREGMHPEALALLESGEHQGVYLAFVNYEKKKGKGNGRSGG